MADEPEKTTEKTYVIPLPGVEEDGEPSTIVMRPPTEAMMAVFARVYGQLAGQRAAATAEREQAAIRNVGLVMQALDQCIVSPDDRAYVDTLLIGLRLSVPDAMGLISEVAAQHYGAEAANTAPANGPVRLVR